MQFSPPYITGVLKDGNEELQHSWLDENAALPAVQHGCFENGM
jgi:hypothetical protein